MFDNINSIEEFYAFSNSDELLQNTVEEYREMLEIKKRLTELSLQNLRRMTEVRKNKYLCYSKSYAKLAENFLSQDFIKNSSQHVNELLKRINNCKRQTKDVKAFLDNVDKLAELKIENCSKNCVAKYLNEEENIQNQINYSKCMWICYNKLDRRYREFWLNQKNDLIERHKSKMYF